MTRKYLSVALLVATLGFALVIATPHAFALTQKQKNAAALACFKKFNGKTYSTVDKKVGTQTLPDSAPADQFLNNKCSSAYASGNCTSHSAGVNKIKVECSKTYGSPPQNTDGLAGTDEKSTDPALNFKSSSCSSAAHCNITTKYINPFINFLSVLAILAVVIGLVWGAIQYVTSGGDPQRVASGKDKIMKALIGLVSFIFLYAFLSWLIPGGLFR